MSTINNKRKHSNIENWVRVSIQNFRTPVVQLAREFESIMLHDVLPLCNILAFRPKLEYYFL